MNRLRQILHSMRDDRGITLAEMVVTMAVGTLLLAAVTALTIQQIRGVDAAEKRNAASLEVTNTLDQAVKSLRTAMTPGNNSAGTRIPAFLAATGETVGFYANLNSLASSTQTAYLPQEVWYWTRTTTGGNRQLCTQTRALTRNAAGNLVFPTTSLANESSRTCKVLVNNLAPADSVPTFTFLASGDDLGANGLATSTLAMTGSAVADTQTIDAVQMRLRVRAGTAREANVVTSSARVALINTL